VKRHDLLHFARLALRIARTQLPNYGCKFAPKRYTQPSSLNLSLFAVGSKSDTEMRISLSVPESYPQEILSDAGTRLSPPTRQH